MYLFPNRKYSRPGYLYDPCIFPCAYSLWDLWPTAYDTPGDDDNTNPIYDAAGQEEADNDDDICNIYVWPIRPRLEDPNSKRLKPDRK
jgi:hypothetical protein